MAATTKLSAMNEKVQIYIRAELEMTLTAPVGSKDFASCSLLRIQIGLVDVNCSNC